VYDGLLMGLFAAIDETVRTTFLVKMCEGAGSMI
jgi:hypothetical protein